MTAPWAARADHTSVVDAAGAIYVIGGGNLTYFKDVWVSTDAGARPDSVKGVVEGYHRGYLRRYYREQGVLGVPEEGRY